MPVATVLPDDGTLDAATRADALLGLVTLRYTQSNSVALVRGGAAIGIGAGQQNRVDCVRLAGAKARTWWLRRHPFVDELPAVDGMGRQDRLNWQIRFAGQEMTAAQLTEFESVFGAAARGRYDDATWRDEWLAALGGVTLTSDGYPAVPGQRSSTPRPRASPRSSSPAARPAPARSPTAPPRTASPTCRPACGCSTTEKRSTMWSEPGSVRTKDLEFGVRGGIRAGRSKS